MEGLEKEFQNKKVMITGGCGFIGSNLARRLLELGSEIVIVDSLHPECGGNLSNIKEIRNKVEFHHLDIGNEKILKLVKNIEVIFNLAGQTGHFTSMINPNLDVSLNYQSQINFLEGIRKENSDAKIIFSSTRQFYGSPKFLPVTEEHPINPLDINGINNWAAEQLHLLYNQVYGMKTSSLRLTNIFGPRQRIKDPKLGVLGFFVGLALKNQPITLFGGNQIRDVTYVDDLIHAFLLAVNNFEKLRGHVFNIGGEKTSLIDFVKLLIQIQGGKYEIKSFPPEKEKIDIGDYYSDDSKFRERTGWQHKTSLEEGIKKTLEFYKENFKIYLK